MARQKTHRLSRTPAYSSYHMMINRCHNPNDPRFYDYGGRGIKVCDRWRESFLNFLEDMGPRPPGTSIGRGNNDGNYEPGNCTWETKDEQYGNMRNTVRLEYRGYTFTLGEWAKILVIKKSTLAHRIRRGWTIKDALSIPAMERSQCVGGRKKLIGTEPQINYTLYRYDNH